jgi:hypothetical protein
MIRYDSHVCLKLSGPLRAALEDEAAAHQRSLSSLIRTVLVNHAAQRVVDRETREAA